MSLEGRRDYVIRPLRHLGLSSDFIRAVDDFVAGRNIDGYFPTEEGEDEILPWIKDWKTRDA